MEQMNRRIGTAMGVVAGLACASLAGVFIWGNPTGRLLHQTGGWRVVTIPLMGVLGVGAAIASLLGASRTLLLLFVISFLPFGAYTLLANNFFHWFGIAQSGYAVSAWIQNPIWMRDTTKLNR
jgi:hypothetical protein